MENDKIDGVDAYDYEVNQHQNAVESMQRYGLTLEQSAQEWNISAESLQRFIEANSIVIKAVKS